MHKRLSAVDRKRAILEAASPIFARQGRVATTTQQVAKAAGISEALLYKHFSSKEDLYSAIENHCVEAIAIGTQLFENAEPSTETFVLTVAFTMHAIFLGIGDQRSHENTKRLVVSSALSDGSFARNFLAKSFAPWLGHFKACFEAARREGHLQDGIDLQDADIWFIHHLATSLHLFALPQDPVISYGMSKAELADRAIVFLLRGIGIREAAIRRFYTVNRIASILQDSNAQDTPSKATVRPR